MNEEKYEAEMNWDKVLRGGGRRINNGPRRRFRRVHGSRDSEQRPAKAHRLLIHDFHPRKLWEQGPSHATSTLIRSTNVFCSSLPYYHGETIVD